MELLSFQEALTHLEQFNKRHVLLGNGFSIACMRDIFSYDALFERSEFQSLSGNAKGLFESLETTDFETVIDALEKASKVFEIYNVDSDELSEVLNRDAVLLRDVFVSAIAGSHPDQPGDISDQAYESCKYFLSHFSRIFTLNYDLLLYWAIMKEDVGPTLNVNDGFRTPEYGESEYVTWEVDNRFGQNIYYLHGALHLFDAGTELQKYTWINTGIRLTDQIREALTEQKFPMFVAEGQSKNKLDKIKHNAYLTRAYESFSRIQGALFIFGHSLADNDEHIIHLIEKGLIQNLYVGLFGDPDSHANQQIVSRARRMANYRYDLANAHGRRVPELFVNFYDAATASPWG